MAVPSPPPTDRAPSPSPLVTPSPTHTPTTVRSYLTPVTSLDPDSLDTLKALHRITVDIRRHTSHTRRIGRGSPGAGALGATLANLQPRLNEISAKLSEVLKTHSDFPGVYLVSRQFPVFRDVLSGNFNDGGNEPGYSERVHLLEKLMYVAGTLRGHVEMVLEQNSYWRAKLAGELPTRLDRRLNFDLAVDPAEAAEAADGEQLGLGGRAAEEAIGRECLTLDHTCNGMSCVNSEHTCKSFHDEHIFIQVMGLSLTVHYIE